MNQSHVKKHIKNCLIVGIYAHQLFINEKLELTSSEFVINLKILLHRKVGIGD